VEQKEKKPRRKYSDEFKLEAIELSKKIGNAKASKELGIYESQIRQWKKKLEGPLMSSHEKKTYGELEKEVRRLAKENGYLKEINKVLKKSTAIFSSDQMGGLK